MLPFGVGNLSAGGADIQTKKSGNLSQTPTGRRFCERNSTSASGHSCINPSGRQGEEKHNLIRPGLPVGNEFKYSIQSNLHPSGVGKLSAGGADIQTKKNGNSSPAPTGRHFCEQNSTVASGHSFIHISGWQGEKIYPNMTSFRVRK